MIHMDPSRITVSATEIASLLMHARADPDQHTRDLVDRCITECSEIISPRGGFVLLDAAIDASGGEIIIEGMVFHTGKIITGMLREAEQVAFFAATAGPGPEALARELMEQGQHLEGYIVDLVGSGLVEAVANQVYERIRDQATSRGKKATNRYSPGYCSWNVEEQQKLFSLLPEGCCGISLSDSSLMVPIKSVSGIVGIGLGVRYQEYTCENCNMKNCIFRKTGS